MTTKKKTPATHRAKANVAPQHIGLVKNDPYLEPYEEAIKGRHDHALWKLSQLTNGGKTSLTDFANGQAQLLWIAQVVTWMGIPGVGTQCHGHLLDRRLQRLAGNRALSRETHRGNWQLGVEALGESHEAW